MLKLFKDNRASGYIDVVVIVLSAMLVIALAVSIFPAYVTKSQMDTFAQELCREAEICGRIGSGAVRLYCVREWELTRKLNGQKQAIFS